MHLRRIVVIKSLVPFSILGKPLRCRIQVLQDGMPVVKVGMNQTLNVVLVWDLPSKRAGKRLEIKVLRWDTRQQVDQYAQLTSIV